jgi:hypothetical protein
MRNRLVALTLLAAGCTSLDRVAVRRTHDDRWREASAAYQRELEHRAAPEPSESAANQPPTIAMADRPKPYAAR